MSHLPETAWSIPLRNLCVGIDLGTTNSCVAYLDGARPQVIANSEGSRTTPSVVAWTPGTQELLVGQAARRQAVLNPQNTYYSTKRLIGRRFEDEEATREAQSVSYPVVRADNGQAWVHSDVLGRDLSPSEIAANVLMKMKKTAEDFLGEKVDEAVITVPAYFDDSQRQATKDAGAIAGLDVKRVINEPTAAALAYGLDKSDGRRTIAVFDLGGGTFDVSILQLEDGVFDVRATNGDTFLGGADFDQALTDYIVDDMVRRGTDPRRDLSAMSRIREAAENAKIELSSSNVTEINLPFLMLDPQTKQPAHLRRRITREELDKVCAPLIARTVAPCRAALADAGLKPGDIDEVVLVGGMTRMPAVIDHVQKIFGRAPCRGVNPDEAVAVGAAIQGGVLSGDVEGLLLLDVAPLSLGIETLGGIFTRLIPRNTTIPTKKTQIFSTAVDNQTSVNIRVYQGERDLAVHNKLLGEFELSDIPPAPHGVPQIEVSFDIDANGITHVSAHDKVSGREQAITVRAGSGLDAAELQRMIDDAEANKAKDAEARQFITLSQRTSLLVESTQQILDQHRQKLPQNLSREAEKILADIHEEMSRGPEEGSLSALTKLKDQLNDVTRRIGNALVGKTSKV